MTASPQVRTASAASPDSALTVRAMLAARQRELQGMGELAQSCELVIAVGQLVHALQKERGQAMLLLSRPSPAGEAERPAWRAQVALAETAETALRERLEAGLNGGVLPLTRPRCLHAVAHALHGLDGLAAFRHTLADTPRLPHDAAPTHPRGDVEHALSAPQALGGYGRVIGSLLGVSIEALEGAADPHITRLLVALLNFMQAKELCGQERAHGVLGFAQGAFQAADHPVMAGLVQAQARSLDLFCQHAPEAALQRWQALQADETALLRLRQLSQGEGPLDAGLARLWFDVCTARIDAMHELEQALALQLAALCRQRVADSEQALAGLNDLTRQYQAVPIDWSSAVAYTLVGQPMDATLSGDALGGGMARSVLDVLLEQGARLHEADLALAQAQRAQQERRRIEQAKWQLVSRHGLTEAAAHEQLLRMAMNTGLTLPDVAERILRESASLG